MIYAAIKRNKSFRKFAGLGGAAKTFTFWFFLELFVYRYHFYAFVTSTFQIDNPESYRTRNDYPPNPVDPQYPLERKPNYWPATGKLFVYCCRFILPKYYD
jgi:hypothetical protein